MVNVLLAIALFIVAFWGSNAVCMNQTLHHAEAAPPKTVTLYPPYTKVGNRYDESRACFSFKTGRNKLPDSTDWDMGYGFVSIGNEDWLTVGTGGPDNEGDWRARMVGLVRDFGARAAAKIKAGRTPRDHGGYIRRHPPAVGADDHPFCESDNRAYVSDACQR